MSKKSITKGDVVRWLVENTEMTPSDVSRCLHTSRQAVNHHLRWTENDKDSVASFSEILESIKSKKLTASEASLKIIEQCLKKEARALCELMRMHNYHYPPKTGQVIDNNFLSEKHIGLVFDILQAYGSLTKEIDGHLIEILFIIADESYYESSIDTNSVKRLMLKCLVCGLRRYIKWANHITMDARNTKRASVCYVSNKSSMNDENLDLARLLIMKINENVDNLFGSLGRKEKSYLFYIAHGYFTGNEDLENAANSVISVIITQNFKELIKKDKKCSQLIQNLF